MSQPEFWSSWFVWKDPLLAAVICAMALGYLGVWVVLRRVVFVPLALAQVSSLGVVFAYLVGSWLGTEPEHAHGAGLLLEPFGLAVLAAVIAAVWLARPREDSSLLVVSTYLVSGAAVLILGGFVRQQMHDVTAVLFGNAVLLELTQVYQVAGAALVVLLLHVPLHGRFLFVSFDPEAAGAAGLPRFRLDALLYVSFALMIASATRAMGALPTFGLMVLPAMTALGFASTMRGAHVMAMGLGTVSAVFGYYLSFRFELPTGACMVGLAGVFYLLGLVTKRR